MGFKARDAVTLEVDVDRILAGFDSDYPMNFGHLEKPETSAKPLL
jgi:hypothetical protein